MADAVVVKVLPGTIRDFCMQTRRSYFATAGDRSAVRSSTEWKAFAAEAGQEPLGAALCGADRAVAAVTARAWARPAHSETWEPSTSTKRGTIR